MNDNIERDLCFKKDFNGVIFTFVVSGGKVWVRNADVFSALKSRGKSCAANLFSGLGFRSAMICQKASYFNIVWKNIPTSSLFSKVDDIQSFAQRDKTFLNSKGVSDFLLRSAKHLDELAKDMIRGQSGKVFTSPQKPLLEVTPAAERRRDLSLVIKEEDILKVFSSLGINPMGNVIKELTESIIEDTLMSSGADVKTIRVVNDSDIPKIHQQLPRSVKKCLTNLINSK